MSVGLDVISGSAIKDNFTLKESPKLIFVVFNSLFELIIPIVFFPFQNRIVNSFLTVYAQKLILCDLNFEIS